MSRQLLVIGTPSTSFLTSCPDSILFNSEKAVFDETLEAEVTRVLFCDIRAKY